jgi:hypothetical protein
VATNIPKVGSWNPKKLILQKVFALLILMSGEDEHGQAWHFLDYYKNEPDKSPIQILWVHEIEENKK